MKHIPLIDISPFLNGSEDGKSNVVREVDQACPSIRKNPISRQA
ncbi:MAG: hypothetical protein AAFY56_07720 [Pseudomonadota bacterium]